jgi:hypothetical protein
MFSHGPSCLNGPVSRERGWWSPDELDSLLPDGAAEPTIEGPGERGDHRLIRTELVERIRREIAEGVYETPEKWEAALDRLFERLQEP